MKKVAKVAILVAMLLIMASSAFAVRKVTELKNAIPEFKVMHYKGYPSEIYVLTVDSGRRGVVVITSPDSKLSSALEQAKELIKTSPTHTAGTKFAVISKKI